MPWSPGSARKHTKKAKSAKSKRQWSKVANSALARGDSEATAIRKANGVIKRGRAKKHGNRRKRHR